MKQIDIASVPSLEFDVGMGGTSKIDSVIEPVTITVMVIIMVV
ncbi:hypothetical protein [Luteimonas fraxinea]|nr:hypothetical protein [Luteimonas fraxinea]